MKTAADFNTENDFSAPEEKPVGEASKCDQDVFSKFKVDFSTVDVKL